MGKSWPKDGESWIVKQDQAIRAGDGSGVAAALEALVPSHIPPAARSRVAWLAWRVGRPEIGLRLLNQTVRGQIAEASNADRAEYAVCLLHFGAVDEGAALLERCDAVAYPKVWLYRSFACAANWQYDAVPGLIRRYLKTPGLSEYDSLVAAVNLASALLYEGETTPALAALRGLAQATGSKSRRLMAGAVAQLKAVALIQKRDFQGASELLEGATKDLAHAAGAEGLFVRKWQAVISLRQHGDASALARVRAEAITLKNWETVRDCDRHLAIQTDDEKIFNRVYAGTPYAWYRHRLLQDCRRKKTPSHYVWNDSPASKPLDLEAWVDRHGAKSGGLIYRFWLALLRDHYRPLRTATLFGVLFPEEFFNPDVSPKRVHEGARRLRALFRKTKVGLDVRTDAEGYRLVALHAVSVRYSLMPSAEVNPYREELAELRRHFSVAPFSTREAARALGLAERSTARVLSFACDSNVVVSQGRARATRYRFTG